MAITSPPAPWLDAEGYMCFCERVKNAQCFLEYGSGGSTIYAANLSPPPRVISVDSDAVWRDKVRSEIPANALVHLEHCNIGPVGEWGYPTNPDHKSAYWKYMVTPWQIAKASRVVPDLILIDGRFRVACFLYSLVAARTGTTILFDDYFDRPKYFVSEQFCHVTEKHGRMAVFQVTKEFATDEITERIAEYSVEPA